MVFAFLTSLLARQHLMLDAKAFLQRHPYAWLAWEPGNWTAPADSPSATLATRLPTPAGERALPIKGEALCFELNPQKARLTLGRNSDSDLPIPDATVSRSHLVIEHREKRWQVQPASPTVRAVVMGFPLDATTWRTLQSKDRIVVGGAELTFLSSEDMAARVQAEAQRLKQ